MMVTQLIYWSQPFGFDDAMLNGILIQARRNNPRDGLTGALIVRHDLYLQLLEGPAAAVDATYGRICKDNRHLAVTLSPRRRPARLFAEWSIRDDPAQSWLGRRKRWNRARWRGRPRRRCGRCSSGWRWVDAQGQG